MVDKKFFSSLSRRIVLICLILIVLPLLVYSVVIWDRDWRIKLNTLFSEFTIIGDSAQEIYSQWLLFRTNQLKTFNKEMQDPSLSMIFVFDEDRSLTFPPEKEALTFYPEILKQAYQQRELVFVGENPYTRRLEVFVLLRVKNELRGLSVDASTWARKFSPAERFSITIISAEGKELFTNRSHLEKGKTQVFTLNEIKEQKLSFLNLHSLRGKHLALRLPLLEALFSLQLEMSAKEISQIEGGKLFQHVLGFFLVVVVLGGIGTWWFVRRMSRPLNSLGKVIQSVGEKDYSKRYEKDRFGFEINRLGELFNHTLDALVVHMEEAKNERVKKELLAKELQIGHEVQKGLFPREIPHYKELELGLGFVPAKEVAGDFYDLFSLDENRLLLAIADGSDKGISACLYSLIVRSLIRSFAQFTPILEEGIVKANQLFCRDTADTGNFVTAWIAFYHVDSKELIFTNCGHFPGVLIHPNGEIEELTTEGIALGATPFEKVEVKTVAINPGSLLFLYTDGLVEAHNKKGDLFGKNRLFDLLKVSYSMAPQQLVDRLIEEINRFTEEVPKHDDLTLFCFKTS